MDDKLWRKWGYRWSDPFRAEKEAIQREMKEESEASFTDWMDAILDGRMTPSMMLLWAPESLLKATGVRRGSNCEED